MNINLVSLLFGLSGRISRAKYWLAAVIYIAIMVVLFGLAYELDIAEEMPAISIVLAVIIYIPVVISGIAVGIKRLHDRDKNGWWLLVFYGLPAVLSGLGTMIGPHLFFSLSSFAFSIWGLVELGFLRGTAGPNQFGSDPLAS
jgi:uncharacterized membrane protein YhaH (DUF805 family)